jgi:hypothetical protein
MAPTFIVTRNRSMELAVLAGVLVLTLLVLALSDLARQTDSVSSHRAQHNSLAKRM